VSKLDAQAAQEAADVRSVMAMPAGHRLVTRLLAGDLLPVFVPSMAVDAAAYRQGWNDRQRWLRDLVQREAPEAWLAMERERLTAMQETPRG
jgi:hypothetical protein